MKARLALPFAALVLSQLGATDCGTVLRDPGFDLWCGDELCAWKVVRGDVERVGTWHEGDSGISFLGDDSAIQQIAPVNHNDGHCIQFDLVANVAADAEVFLHVDVEADGTIERSERIPTSSWKPLSFHIFIDPPYDGIRFEISKRGVGTAVLAQIGAVMSDGCEGIPPIDPGARPNGAACFDGGECASGICGAAPFAAPAVAFGVCMGCDPAAPACGAGEVCGVGEPLSPVLAIPIECVPEASRELAELCVGGAECASGICSNVAPGDVGRCSGCKVNNDCGGDTCDPAWVATDEDIFTPDHVGPEICRPDGANPTGSPCGDDNDCASGRCSGSALKVCNDGRSCENPGDCPIEDSLAPGTCTLVGIQGGTCD